MTDALLPGCQISKAVFLKAAANIVKISKNTKERICGSF